MLNWDAATWAQVGAAVAAAVAAFFSWRSARSSASAGRRMVLAAEHQRLDSIRQIVTLWNGAGDGWRRDHQADLLRLLRLSDDLPRTRELAEASNVSGTFDEHGKAVLEMETALQRVEDELKG